MNPAISVRSLPYRTDYKRWAGVGRSVTVVVVAKQEYCVFWVCVCILVSIICDSSRCATFLRLCHISPQYPTILHITPHYPTILHITPQYSTLPHITPHYPTILHITPHYPTILHITPHYSTILHITPHYPTILHITPQYSTLPHITPQYSTLPDITPHFPTFPHINLTNGTIFGKMSLNTKHVFWFSLQFVSEIFLILRIIQRDIVVNAHVSVCMCSACYCYCQF